MVRRIGSLATEICWLRRQSRTGIQCNCSEERNSSGRDFHRFPIFAHCWWEVANKIARSSRTNTMRMSASLARSRDWRSCSRSPPGAGPPSRHLRHTLAVQIDFTNAFDPRQDVIHSLAAESHKFRADNPRHKVTRQIENLLRRRTVEPLA